MSGQQTWTRVAEISPNSRKKNEEYALQCKKALRQWNRQLRVPVPFYLLHAGYVEKTE
jgi:hypothetical protein